MTHKVRNKKQQTPSLSPTKKRIFTLFALFFPIFILFLFEIGLRIGNYGGDTRLFVPVPTDDSPYFGLNQNAGRRFFHHKAVLPSPRKDLFLREKPENGFRIFVLGGSTTAGFPYGNNLTFPRILHRRLVSIFPEKHIEVVNCAFTAINTYTMLDYMDEILDQQPDLLLIYAGHNEFYGALGVASMESLGQNRWFVKGYLKLQRLKIFLWVRNIINSLHRAGSKNDLTEGDPSRTFMSKIVRDKKIPYGSRLYEKGIEQFRGNMQDIIKKAGKNDVPVILSELVSNVRDFRPFVSVKTDRYPAALEEFKKAVKAEQSEDFDKAKQHYLNAKDYDALRFRASEELNDIVHELANRYNLPVVPMRAYFEKNSPHGLIGENLMWEHLHPKSNGYFIMADAFLQTIGTNGYIVPDWSTKKVLPSRAFEEAWGFTKLDSVYAEMIIRHLKGSWPFVQDGRPNTFMTQFAPQTIEEQIAFRTLRDGEGTLEQGHLKLAAEYEKNKEFAKAYKEYFALIYTVPTLELFYEPLVQLLLKLNKHELALQILFEALKYQDSAFVHKWIGQIYLVLDETARGIRYMENALKREPNDEQTVYNIARAYYKIGRIKNGDQQLEKLRPKFANTKEFQNLLEFRELMLAEHQ